mmetsp:Transcript_10990/g.45759  ORF Transcript_10990/g.45759 Transcript_10990/m.45759 type:complete len:265 (-) Transcript_10990:3247-4041(-)
MGRARRRGCARGELVRVEARGTQRGAPRAPRVPAPGGGRGCLPNARVHRAPGEDARGGSETTRFARPGVCRRATRSRRARRGRPEVFTPARPRGRHRRGTGGIPETTRGFPVSRAGQRAQPRLRVAVLATHGRPGTRVQRDAGNRNERPRKDSRQGEPRSRRQRQARRGHQVDDVVATRRRTQRPVYGAPRAPRVRTRRRASSQADRRGERDGLRVLHGHLRRAQVHGGVRGGCPRNRVVVGGPRGGRGGGGGRRARGCGGGRG